jgi:outer membrane biosynthesis protein TonB
MTTFTFNTVSPSIFPFISRKLTLRAGTPLQEHTSRSSSPSTLVGDEDEMSPFVHPMPAPKLPELMQLASVSAEAPQPDTSMTTAPKKKKKKSKKNKNTASTMPNPTQPHISGNARGSAGLDEDYHTYDPFASQLSHIDAIRRAVNYDTSSYFARTNARIEKEAEERKEAGRSPKASRF